VTFVAISRQEGDPRKSERPRLVFREDLRVLAQDLVLDERYSLSGQKATSDDCSVL